MAGPSRCIIAGENRMSNSLNFMFPLQAAVVNALNLDADLLVQAAEHFAAGYAAGAAG